MAREWSIPKRYCELTLYKGRKQGDLKKVDILSKLTQRTKISFDTSETVSGAANETSINITGLNREVMLSLATAFNQWVENPIHNRITVDAGYENLHGIIFDGEILEALPNLDVADFSIQLRCMSNYAEMLNNTFSLSYNGDKKASEIAQDIATRSEQIFINGLTKDVIVTDYSYNDKNAYQHVRNLSKITGLDVWITNGRLTIKNRFKQLAKAKTFFVNSSNMIGSPQPSALGCNVKIRLNSSIEDGMIVKIDSFKFPQLNSYEYTIQTFSQHGDTKGSNWYTNLTLVRTNISGR